MVSIHFATDGKLHLFVPIGQTDQRTDNQGHREFTLPTFPTNLLSLSIIFILWNDDIYSLSVCRGIVYNVARSYT